MKMFGIAFALFALAVSTQAGEIPLPTTLNRLLPSGNYTQTGGYTFTDFSYSTSPTGTPPLPKDITVGAFNAGIEKGLTFSGALYAAPNTTVDYTIEYTLHGIGLNDATLSGVFGTFGTGGTGSGSVDEVLIDKTNGNVIGHMDIASGGPLSDIIDFSPISGAILVEKDVILTGGNDGASITIVNQGFSSTTGIVGVPEPSSLVMFGIGSIAIVSFLAIKKWRMGIA